jgi:hypothetical protein
MNREVILEKYRKVLTEQGYGWEEVSETVLALGVVLDRRPEMMHLVDSILTNPPLSGVSWMSIEVPAGNRMSPRERNIRGFIPVLSEELEKQIKERREKRGAMTGRKHRKKYERKDPKTLRSGFQNKGRRPTSSQKAFNSTL